MPELVKTKDSTSNTEIKIIYALNFELRIFVSIAELGIGRKTRLGEGVSRE